MMTRHFDVVVIGAGPAGLAAAQAAAQRGTKIALIDDNPRAGGQIWRQGPRHGASARLHDALAALERHAQSVHFGATRVVAPLADRSLLLESRGADASIVSYAKLIVATGARERLLPVPGWTLPGVTGAGGLQALVKGGMPVRGERIVIAGSGPLLIASLATAREAGADVVAVLEQADAAAVARFSLSLALTPGKLWQAMRLTHGFTGMRYWTSSVVRAVHGGERVEAVTVVRGARETTLACDRLACGYGLVPNATLAQALGCALVESAIVVDDAQRTSIDDVFAAGECTGVGGVELASIEGTIAGLAACGKSVPPRMAAERQRWRRFAQRAAQAFALGQAARRAPPDDTLLCRCEDVTFGAVAVHSDWRSAKLHTRCGMGACQGRICGTAAQLYFGWPIAAPRAPLVPARLETLIAAGAAAGQPPIIEPSSTSGRDA